MNQDQNTQLLFDCSRDTPTGVNSTSQRGDIKSEGGGMMLCESIDDPTAMNVFDYLYPITGGVDDNLAMKSSPLYDDVMLNSLGSLNPTPLNARNLEPISQQQTPASGSPATGEAMLAILQQLQREQQQAAASKRKLLEQLLPTLQQTDSSSAQLIAQLLLQTDGGGDCAGGGAVSALSSGAGTVFSQQQSVSSTIVNKPQQQQLQFQQHQVIQNQQFQQQQQHHQHQQQQQQQQFQQQPIRQMTLEQLIAGAQHPQQQLSQTQLPVKRQMPQQVLIAKVQPQQPLQIQLSNGPQHIQLPNNNHIIQSQQSAVRTQKIIIQPQQIQQVVSAPAQMLGMQQQQQQQRVTATLSVPQQFFINTQPTQQAPSIQLTQSHQQLQPQQAQITLQQLQQVH